MNTTALTESPVLLFTGAPAPSELTDTSGLWLQFLTSEKVLASVAMALGAATVGQISNAELKLGQGGPNIPGGLLEELVGQINGGKDPLGSAFCLLRSAKTRREQGAIYTPAAIVGSMLDWAESNGSPQRVVEPGSGPAPFLLEAAKRFPAAELVAVEVDPLAALLARANTAVAGLSHRTRVLVEDFRSADLGQIEGQTLFVGNPPYVRHHLIESRWKDWLKNEANALGIKASALAGLHAYFFLVIARCASSGDYGALVTAAEWLDVNYGQLMRELFLGRLGGNGVAIIEPETLPFPGVAATGAITTFEINSNLSSARFTRVTAPEDIGNDQLGVQIVRDRLVAESRWSHFTRMVPDRPAGYIELGELCAVHRGQVTGANEVWIEGLHSTGLPEEVLFPTVTKAKELFQSGMELRDVSRLRRVINLPENLSAFSLDDLEHINQFLKRAEQMGVRGSYTSRHRKAWWSVGLRNHAPILATYMARRPPAFVLNEGQARHLNIAHGIYPREPLEDNLLKTLVKFLRSSSSMAGGRVYAGGLTKFEPREMERIPIPNLGLLREMAL